MSEHFRISFYVLYDIDVDDNFYGRIIESIKKISGVISVLHAQGTNTVKVSAKWTESEYDTRIIEIRKIANVTDLKIFKRVKHVAISLKEHVGASERLTLKTTKARRISRILDSSIIQTSIEMKLRIKFLILGPGKNSNEYESHRLTLKRLIENDAHQQADFPEDLKDKSENVIIKEYRLMMDYDYIFILIMRTGSVSEFSSFLSKKDIANKIWLFIPKKYSRSRSFLKTGPIQIFKKYLGRVCYFSQPDDLIEKAEETIINILTYELFAK